MLITIPTNISQKKWNFLLILIFSLSLNKICKTRKYNMIQRKYNVFQCHYNRKSVCFYLKK